MISSITALLASSVPSHRDFAPSFDFTDLWIQALKHTYLHPDPRTLDLLIDFQNLRPHPDDTFFYPRRITYLAAELDKAYLRQAHTLHRQLFKQAVLEFIERETSWITEEEQEAFLSVISPITTVISSQYLGGDLTGLFDTSFSDPATITPSPTRSTTPRQK